ncbi:unnamed protein product [Caenorhabditis angaria]|uniref:Peptidase metallopeptidase domain-containing protein n=1 Tax=Caenorhabditis angaria TaxID=860376 RepID=A0A9P1IIV7_9PELO|nr:unnamed protein product [Caenorhabditis angaria]
MNFQKISIILYIFIKFRISREEEDVEPTKFLQNFGYLPAGTHQFSQESMRKAVKKMQKMAGIRETGEIDGWTKYMMAQPRCGIPDVEVRKRAKRSGPAISTWNKKVITYGVLAPSSNAQKFKRSLVDIRRAARQAAQQWSDLADIEIIEAPNGVKPDIRISVERDGYHQSCSFPFQHGTLAHAFQPPYGNIHLNENVDFVMTNFTENFGSNSLFSVVVHEMGHALGFDHNEEKDSVMFAYDTIRKWRFTERDRYFMRMSYGSKKSSPTSSTRSPPAPKPIPTPTAETDTLRPPKLCEIENPVIVNYRNEYLIFKNAKITEAIAISAMFPGLVAAPIQAALVVQGQLWVFVDDKIYVIHGRQIVHAPISLKSLGINETSIDLAYEWHYFKPPAIYLWKNEKYWKLDEHSWYRKSDERYPRNISLNWANVPKNVASAFNFQDEIHFVRDNLIYRMNSSRAVFDVENGYPIRIQQFFKFFS